MASSWAFIKRRILMRGESAVAWIGIGGAALLLGALGGCGWWTLRTLRTTQIHDRSEQARVVGQLLADSLQPMFAAGELSPMRQLLVQAGHTYGLSTCRVVLSEGQILADAQPSRINVRVLPVAWSSGPLDPPPVSNSSTLYLSYPLHSGIGRTARLELAASLVDPSWGYWQSQSGIAMVGAAALAALLLAYRWARTALGPVGAVQEALLASNDGETAPAALLVDPKLGAVAAAWNRLLGQQQLLQQKTTAERTIERLEARRSGGSDAGGGDAAWDSIPHGLLLVNADLSVQAANGAAAVLLKRRRDDIPGRQLGDMIADEGVLTAVREIAAGTTQRPVVCETQRQGGETGFGVLRISVRPVRKQDAAAAMLVIEDITQQRIAEQSRNAFIAQVTHELRTPLTNIRLYVETAIDDGEDNPAVRSNCLNVINGETRRLERIVSEMLSVAEIEAGSFKVRSDDVYPDVLLDELKNDYAAQAADKKIQLVFNRPPKLPKLKGDRDKIALALHNLIGNALKYTPSSGHVTVTTDVRDKTISIDVSDTGIGIAPEEAEKVFDKFYRSNDPRVGKITGTGLGLTLAREVIRLHGGDVTLQSELNKGSTFTATLPVPAEAA